LATWLLVSPFSVTALTTRLRMSIEYAIMTSV
jgi:hypothetical protein